MNNKDLDSDKTLTTFYLVTAQLVYTYDYFSRINEFFSRSSTILHIYNLSKIVFYLDTYLGVNK